MRRVRHTHAKFAAMNATTAAAEEDDPMVDPGAYGANAVALGSRVAGAGGTSGPGGYVNIDDEVVQDNIDESPWTMGKRNKGKGKAKLSGIELGAENATDCLRWTTNKVLEHAGFQGRLLRLVCFTCVLLNLPFFPLRNVIRSPWCPVGCCCRVFTKRWENDTVPDRQVWEDHDPRGIFSLS